MFKKPSMLDDLDVAFKSDESRKVIFYYQVNLKNVVIFLYFTLKFGEQPTESEEKKKMRVKRSQRNIHAMQRKESSEEKKQKEQETKDLFTTTGFGPPLTGRSMYFLRTSTK